MQIGGLVRCLCVAAVLVFVTSCARKSSDWDRFAANYLDDYFAAHPEIGAYAGRHEFDGKLSDFSRAGFQREIERLRAARQRASSFQERDLDRRQRFERNYLLFQINRELFWLEKARWPFRNPYYYIWGPLVSPIEATVYLTRPYAPLDLRMAVFLAYERALPQALQQIRSVLEAPMPRNWIDIGHAGFGGMADYFERDVPSIFATVKDAGLQAEFRKTNADAVSALRALDSWIEGLRRSATEDFAMGPETFVEMLRVSEGVNSGLDLVAEAGRRDLERNLAALRRECERYAPGVAEGVARQAAQKPKGKLLDVAREQLTQLRKFVADKQLVSIPGKGDALVAESPPYARWTAAYLDPIGPYDKGLPFVYYLSPPDPKWPPEEQRAYIPAETSLLFLSVHEVWPGHFLQFLHANHSDSTIGPVLATSGFTEGWAHYAEEMMWEAGFGDNRPEVHIGQLTMALLRDVRFLSAIGMHTGTMSVTESERMFREKAFADPGTARQQAARGTFDPTYLNYTLGKLMIRKLRDDWTAGKNGRASWREFHDRFLSYGSPPIPLIRAELLGASAGPPL